jgi:hypothetical protein
MAGPVACPMGQWFNDVCLNSPAALLV